ncbi:MAG: hypothetical protein IKY23_01260 [Lachnospiraceae bacterium]|nr:hypothetical protein [Lachnospiraceae bacterium]
MKKKLIAIVLCLSVIFSLTACGKGNEEKETEVLLAEVEDGAEEVEKAEAIVEAEPTEEYTPEPTEEPTPEPIVYEGIDMESTLPAAEWTLSFVGVIDEPKFVIANDETNKKRIVEQGEEVKLEDGDMFILYEPKGKNLKNTYGSKEIGGIMPEKSVYINDYCDQILFWNGPCKERSTFEVTIPSAEGEIVVSCIMITEQDD